MSSRAAASRKRLQDPSASTKKGLFSRSKTAAPPPSKDVRTSYPSPPDRNVPLPQAGLNSAPPGSTAFSQSPNHPYENRHFSNGHVPNPQPSRDFNAYHDPAYGRTRTATLPSPHTSPREEQLRPSPRQPPSDFSQLSSRQSSASSGRGLHSPSPQPSYQPPVPVEQYSHSQVYSASDSTFFEASYQPPPPIQSDRPQSPRALPSYPTSSSSANRPATAESHKSPRVLAQPGTTATVNPRNANPTRPKRPSTRPLPIYSAASDPDYQFGPPSPSNSPPNNSLLLQPSQSFSRHSELPAYASPPGSQSDLTRPSLQVSTDRDYYSQPEQHQNYGQYRSPYEYPSPPTSDPRYTPSPLRYHSPDTSAASFSDSSQSQVRQQSYQPFPRSRENPAASIISTSSGSSRHSNDSASVSPANGDTPKSFIFPGSRSTARPRVSKSGTPQIKLRGKRSKSRVGRSTDPSDTSITSPTSANGSNSGSQYVPSIDARSPISPNDARNTPLIVESSRSSMGSSIQQQERARTKSSPSAVQTEPSKPAFVYPLGRTRAHPKTPPKPKVRTRKKSTESASSGTGKSSKFLGITIKKKKKPAPLLPTADPASPLAHTLGTPLANGSDENMGRGLARTESTSDQSSNPQTSSSSQYPRTEGSLYENPGPLEPPPEERPKLIKTKVGSYPLDPYDSTLLDNDRHTGELLRRISPAGSPTFHDYGNVPPMAALDLGCGQGHWVLDAAIAWKGYGTRVTGMDMVDISKSLRPWALKQGVAENIRFIRGNFVKQRLPFPTESFDLVRMSCLALCIAAERWEFVLQEVYRVLSPGGRIEFIDDHLFFPYGKAPLGSDLSLASPLPRLDLPIPQLDIQIPSSSFSTFSICDSGHLNPGLGAHRDEDERADEALYDLYGVQEEEFDDAATVSGHNSLDSYDTFGNPRATPVPQGSYGPERRHSNTMGASFWNQQAATSRELESLFEDMLYYKYGIHTHPSEFILDLLKHVFGFSRHVRTMHLTLAPPDTSPPVSNASSADGHETSYRHYAGRLTPMLPSGRSSIISHSPGLILWPSTFIPMQNAEIEIHASKHLRTLLSCKNNLVEYTLESADENEVDEDSVLEAFWEYESFLRPRFNPPPDNGIPTVHHAREDTESIQEHEPFADDASVRDSIFSVTSEGQDAMLEYQSELRGLFVPTSFPESPRLASDPTAASQIMHMAKPNGNVNANDSQTANNHRETVVSTSGSSVAPPYSRNELVHVRTFHVYEAIKVDAAILGTSF